VPVAGAPDGRGEWGTGVRTCAINPANETLASPLRKVKIDKGSAADLDCSGGRVQGRIKLGCRAPSQRFSFVLRGPIPAGFDF